MSNHTPHWLQEIRDYWAKLEEERQDVARSAGCTRDGTEAPEDYTCNGAAGADVSSYARSASRAALSA